MSNRLFFNAREWSFNKACEKNAGERCFINGIEGSLVEVYTIGNWSWDWTEIMSKPMMLEKNTQYSFCFWLNGGEDDRNQEVCQFRVVFDGDHEDSRIYKLNRGYIKPLKRYKGWELYDINFMTGDNDLTQLKFVARSAYMAVQPAKEPEAYAELQDIVDEFEGLRPQRHNIIFEDGWPSEKWYSTKELRKKQGNAPKGDTKQGFEPNFGFNFGTDMEKNIRPNFGENFGPNFGANFGPDFGANFGADLGKNFGSDFVEDLKKRVRNNIMNDIDIDDLVDDITDDIDVDDLMDDIKDQIDVDSLREEIKKEILKRMK